MKFNLSNPIDKNKFDNRVKYLRDNNKNVELKEIRKKRTLNQNSYLHVLISLYCIEFGYNREEGKVHLKRLCDFMRYDKNGEVFLKRSRDLNTKEMTIFIDWIRNHSSMEGCYLPTSEEYLTHQIEIDKEIDRHGEYL